MGTNEINNNTINLKNILKNKSVKKFLKENNLINQLSNKSLFMVTQNGVKIDIEGDGTYDKQINCVFDNNGQIKECNSFSDIPQENTNKPDLAQMLNNLYGKYGLSFSAADNPENTTDKNQTQTFQQQEPEQPTLNYQPTTINNIPNNSNFGFTPKAQPQTSLKNLQQSIQNLGLEGVSVEIVDYKPQKS